MRITYDRLPEGRTFPLGRTATKRFVDSVAPATIRERITKVHFGANAKTHQEARLAGRGRTFEIRINFWLDHGTSRVVRDIPKWTKPVEVAGGTLHENRAAVDWPGNSAVIYSGFLLAHEIAHVVYAAEHGNETLLPRSDGQVEESWCDTWAMGAVEVLRESLAAKR